MTHRKIFIVILLLLCRTVVSAQSTSAVKQFVQSAEMKHASVGCLVKEVGTGKILCSYDPQLQLTPASVLKVITTATALELLGEEYRYPTELLYDGAIRDSVLHGNIYIKGHGDPTLGSAYFAPKSKEFIHVWVKAIREAGIRRVTGAVIADESIFDTEGISMKWVREDLGSYYGAGSYGLNVFDNKFDLYVSSGSAGTRPKVVDIRPQLRLDIHNFLRAAAVKTDSSYVVGMPFSAERYLYGVVPAHRERFRLKGDIPEPPLFLAQYLAESLRKAGVQVAEGAASYRQYMERGDWNPAHRTEIITTYSPTLLEIVKQTNHVSHNLFADALLKTLGLRYKPRSRGEVISSFDRGVQVVRSYWKSRGVDVSAVHFTDGSGLAPTNKVTTGFMADILLYMAARSRHADAFLASLPVAGKEGSVRNFLKDTPLSGKAWLKSGSMSRVRCYAGYVKHGGKRYVVVLLANNFSGTSWRMNRNYEKLLLRIFP